jgi:ATP adenylyltransferase
MLQTGTLWNRVLEQTEHALQCGALQSIPTDYEFVEQEGIHFLVRILSNLVRKEVAQQQVKASTGKEFNPFSPYETDLFVANLSKTHLCLLNKFNVVDHHLLVVTRDFEEQENWLTLPDFEALVLCLSEIDGLAFYNGGQPAGASQRHKHLQLVPFPLTPKSISLPIATAIAQADFRNNIGTSSVFPFIHAIARLNLDYTTPTETAQTILEAYQSLLQAVGLINRDTPLTEKQSAPYNLLITREWMLIVPRSQESYHGISVNSLGFAGALLVRHEEQMKLLKEHCPLTILQNVGIPQC